MKFGKLVITAILGIAGAITGFAGNLEIVKAVYGADNTWADVKDKVSAAVSGENLSIKASNDIFGDPISGTAKELKVTIKYNDKLYDVSAKEGSSLDVNSDKLAKMLPGSTEKKAATSSAIKIIKAEYGAESSWTNVTEKVQSAVNGGASEISANNENFGDPIEGTAKVLKVKYTINGKEETKEASENSVLKF